MKSILHMLFGAFIAAAIGTAAAVVGTPPGTGPALQDGVWLNGLAGGQNYSYTSGISAAGTTHATSTQLAAGYRLYEVDTAAASSGVSLPAALAGTAVSVYNNGSNTLTVYPQIANNPVTGAQDTINNSTTFSGDVATHVSLLCFAAKNGVWACK